MRFTHLFCVLVLAYVTAALAQTQPPDNRSLGDVARDTREQKRFNPNSQSAHMKEFIADMSVNDPEAYREQMAELLSHHDFEGLDRAAEIARADKSRFPGGPWKLYSFYDAVSHPFNGPQASDTDWNSHLALLQQWISNRSQSSTAQIALAQAYLNYGRKARGNGYAATVSDEGWQHSNERSDLALSALKQAAGLPEKCPYWYEAMMQVAIAQGWSKAQTKALLDDSIAFEPGFYHVYREYANYLQPKWYGDEGDAEAFAEVISQRIGREEGSFIYFEIATVLNCAPCGNLTGPANLSWSKIKDGYASMEHLYGVSDLKMNRFALLTIVFRDKVAAKEIFARIGDKWDSSVWTNRERFEKAKAWASN